MSDCQCQFECINLSVLGPHLIVVEKVLEIHWAVFAILLKIERTMTAVGFMDLLQEDVKVLQKVSTSHQQEVSTLTSMTGFPSSKAVRTSSCTKGRRRTP